MLYRNFRIFCLLAKMTQFWKPSCIRESDAVIDVLLRYCQWQDGERMFRWWLCTLWLTGEPCRGSGTGACSQARTFPYIASTAGTHDAHAHNQRAVGQPNKRGGGGVPNYKTDTTINTLRISREKKPYHWVTKRLNRKWQFTERLVKIEQEDIKSRIALLKELQFFVSAHRTKVYKWWWELYGNETRIVKNPKGKIKKNYHQ